MNLVTYITGIKIAGHSKEDLELIIVNGHPNTHVVTKGDGVIILSDGSLVKCVANYYEGNEPISKKSRSSVNRCHEVQKALDVPHRVGTDCLSCHLNCLRNPSLHSK